MSAYLSPNHHSIFYARPVDSNPRVLVGGIEAMISMKKLETPGKSPCTEVASDSPPQEHTGPVHCAFAASLTPLPLSLIQLVTKCTGRRENKQEDSESGAEEGEEGSRGDEVARGLGTVKATDC